MGLLGNLFGKKDGNSKIELKGLVGELLEEMIAKANFQISFDLEEDTDAESVKIELYGEDEELFLNKEGQLLDSIQLFLKRVVQHQMPDSRVNIVVDCGDFRAQANQSLIDLAEKLKGIVLDKNKPVYFRALPPRDRKVIHQYLAEDGRVKSRSIGDGLYKKIKIFPAKFERRENQGNRSNRNRGRHSNNGDYVDHQSF